MIKVEKRQRSSPVHTALVVSISVLSIAFGGGILLLIVGANPIQTYIAMAKGALGSSYALSETLVKAIPLMLTGLAVLIAFKVKFWNIGAEGQFAMGAAAATGFALYTGNTFPVALKLPGMFLVAFVAAMLWGIIPAILKIYLGVSEVLSTLMFNYIGVQAVEYLYYGPWSDPGAFGFGGTAMIAKDFWLPKISGRLHVGIFMALAIALLLSLLLSRTKWGYEIVIVGDNPRAGKYVGINVVKTILVVAAFSAGTAGIAGAIEIAGIAHRLQTGVVAGYGFTAIIVVFLARLGPTRTVIISVFLAALLVGGDQLQLTMKLPSTVAVMLQGALFISVLAGEFFIHYKLTFRLKPFPRRKESEAWIQG